MRDDDEGYDKKIIFFKNIFCFYFYYFFLKKIKIFTKFVHQILNILREIKYFYYQIENSYEAFVLLRTTEGI